MSIKGVILQPIVEECPYIANMISISENFVAKEIDVPDMENLLKFGFRHFGEAFFRPMCSHCMNCVSIRIPVQSFTPSPSIRRLFKRAQTLTVTLEDPNPSQEAYDLYNIHKMRFARQIHSSYENFVKSFFHPYSFSKILTIKDGPRLIGISHLDITENTMSAVYCYYDTQYYKFSPGKLAIYKEIELAKRMGIAWLYLGFYVPGNKHTAYKIDIIPNQLMLPNGQWMDYKDNDGKIINEYPFPTPRQIGISIETESHPPHPEA